MGETSSTSGWAFSALDVCINSASVMLAGAEVILETLSHSPRVFSLFNFMDMQEADQIIEDALGMTQEEYRLKVSVRVTPACVMCANIASSVHESKIVLSVHVSKAVGKFATSVESSTDETYL